MRAKVLAQAKFRVVGIMEGDTCPSETFLSVGEEASQASRAGLARMLAHVAQHGLQGCPGNWYHEANKQWGIYEFIKGHLRLFFFKGENGDIAVCTSGLLKKGQKADKSAVKRAHEWRTAYAQALRDKTYEVIEDEDE